MSDELELLIERYLSGGATEEEIDRLEVLLREDPSALREFVLALDEDVSLRKLFAYQGARKEATPAEGGFGGEGRTTSRRLPSRFLAQPAFNVWAPVMAGAGLLAGLFLLFAFLGYDRSSGRSQAGRGKLRTPPRTVPLAPSDVQRLAQERESAEERVRALEKEREEVARPASAPLPNTQEERDQKARLARLDQERHAAQEEMRLARERETKAREDLAREESVPTPGPLPPPPPSPTGPSKTRVEESVRAPALVIESVQGEAWIQAGGGGKAPAEAGRSVLPGQGLDLPVPDGRLVARFPDGSRLDLVGKTQLREVFDQEPAGPSARGKRLSLAWGTLEAQVKKQPPDQPMVIGTPQAQAKVLGTTLKLIVEPEEKGQTRLLVKEGRVRLTRTDGRFADVAGGYEAVAGVGIELLPRPQDSSLNVPRAGLAAWFRADQGVVTNGPQVSLWADRSGNNRHAVQPVASCQPLFVRNAVGGHPALRFDGVDDALSFPLAVTALPGMTLFLVSSTIEERSGGVNGSGHAALFWHETENFGTVLLTPGPSKVRFFFGTSQNQAVFAFTRPAPIDRAYSLSTALKNGPEALLFLNGRECHRVAGQKPLIAQCDKVAQIGRGEGDLLTNRQFLGQYEGWTYFSGEIAEILVYTRALGDPERSSVEQYLLAKYFSK